MDEAPRVVFLTRRGKLIAANLILGDTVVAYYHHSVAPKDTAEARRALEAAVRKRDDGSFSAPACIGCKGSGRRPNGTICRRCGGYGESDSLRWRREESR